MLETTKIERHSNAKIKKKTDAMNRKTNEIACKAKAPLIDVEWGEKKEEAQHSTQKACC